MGSEYDVFLSHHGADKPEVELLANRLQREAGIRPFLDKWHLVAGKSWQPELAHAIDCSASAAIFFGPHSTGPWHNEEIQVLLDKAARSRDDFRVIPILLAGANADRIDPFLKQRTWVDFRRGLDDHSAFQRLVAAIKGAAVAPDGYELPDEPAPYRGLERFEAEQKDYFFGREDDIRRLAKRLADNSFVAMVGASGCGKSSLARAGLHTDLALQELPAIRDWNIVTFLPGSDSFRALAEQIVAAVSPSDRIGMVDNLTERFKARADGLRTAIGALFAESPKTILIVVDQFEEIFTHLGSIPDPAGPPPAQADRLIANLVDAIEESDGRIRVLITIRADFIPQCLEHPQLRSLLEHSQLLLGELGPEALREAVKFPARKVGAFFESGLVEVILRDVRQQRGSLPLLQHALKELWQARRGPWLTLEAYEKSGGVAGALSRRAQYTYEEKLRDHQLQAIARSIFLRLMTLGDGVSDTRRRVPREELYPVGIERRAVDEVLAALSHKDARLVVVNDDNTVEVTHEALIHSWDTFRGWIEENREQLRLRRSLTDSAKEWDKRAKDPSYLYRGGRLEDVEAWANSSQVALNSTELAFLEASLAQREREARERVAALKHQKRLTKRFQIVAVAAGFLALVSLGLLILANIQRQNAEKASREANRQLGHVNWQLGARARDDEKHVLLSGHFFLRAASAFQSAGERALAKNAALAATLANRALIFTLPRYGPVRGALFTPDESRILVWNEPNGMALLWSLDQNVPMRVGSFVPVDGAVFNRDGSRILTWYRQGALLWATNQEKPIQSFSHRVGLDSGGVNGAVFNRDESRILTWSGDGTARLWTAGQKEAVQIFLHQGSVNGAVFNRDESRVLTWSADGAAKLWALGPKEPVQIFLHQGSVNGAVFNRDESRVLTWSADGTAKLWALGPKEPVQIFLHQGSVNGAVFNRDESQILTWSKDGTAKLWVVGQKEPIQSFEHCGEVSGAMFNRDESWILTWSAGWRNWTGTPSGDGTAKLWDQGPYKRNQTIGHKGEIVGATFDPAGTRILTLGGDRTARLWALDWNEPLGTFEHTGDVLGAEFTRDGSRILTWSSDGTVRLWAPNQNEPVQTFERRGGIEGAEFSRDGSRILTWSIDGTARLWASGENEPIRIFNKGFVAGAQFSLDRSRILTWSKDGIIRLWALDETEPIQTLNQTGEFSGAVLNSDGSRILTWSRDGMIRLWVVGRKEAIESFQQKGRITGAAFNLDGSRILTWGTSGAWLWTSGNNAPIQISGQYDSEVRGAEFNRDSSRVLTWSANGTGKLWALGQKEPLRTFKSQVNGAVFDRDGSQILTWAGGTVQLWAPDQNEPIQTFEHDPYLRINGAEFNLDGSRILTWGEDETARLWARDHKEPIQIFKHRSGVIRGIFNNDESRILTWSRNGPVQLWDISFDEKVPPDERIVELQVRSATEVSPSSQLRHLSFDEWRDAKQKLDAMRAKHRSLK